MAPSSSRAEVRLHERQHHGFLNTSSQFRIRCTAKNGILNYNIPTNWYKSSLTFTQRYSNSQRPWILRPQQGNVWNYVPMPNLTRGFCDRQNSRGHVFLLLVFKRPSQTPLISDERIKLNCGTQDKENVTRLKPIINSGRTFNNDRRNAATGPNTDSSI
jgi:hypothetical protein